MKSLSKILFFSVLFTFGFVSKDNNMSSSAINWLDVADRGSQSLLSKFWNTQYEYFNEASDSARWGGHYWPQAHALDVMVDAYLRTNDAGYIPYFEGWLRGVRVANGNQWANNYIDDMEWIGLASFRAWKATGNAEFLTAVREVWD